MACTMPMSIELDKPFNNAELTCTPHNVADTSTHQPHERKFETPRWLKHKCSTLESCVTKHRKEARELAKSRKRNQLSMRRRVQFHPSVKKHDGISTANAHLERVIKDFWKNQTVDLLTELSRDSKNTELNKEADALANRAMNEGCSSHFARPLRYRRRCLKFILTHTHPSKNDKF